ncbi:Sec1-like protein [Dipodascopsis uninucleata]
MTSSSNPVKSKAIKADALSSFLALLETVRGKKSLVLDRALSAPLGYIARFSVLQEHGVDNIFWLEDGPQKDTVRKSIIYLIRGNLKNAKIVADQIKRLVQVSESDYDFNIFLCPRRMLSVERIFEEEGVLGDVTINEWNLGFIPLEDDFFSIELADAGYKDLYLRGLPTTVNYSALALNALQKSYGLFPKIYGKGANAKKLSDMLVRLRLDSTAAQHASNSGLDSASISSSTSRLVSSSNNPTDSNIFEQLIIIERGCDMITPMMTQLTYEGLINEVFGIKNSQAEIPSSVLTAQNSKLGNTSSANSMISTTTVSGPKLKKIILDSNDLLYSNIRDVNFALVGPTLNKVARKLNEDYEERHQAKTVSQIKEFVSKLSGLQAEHQSLRLHTNLAEEIMNRTQTELFNRSLEVQQNLVASGLDPSVLNQSIEEMIAKCIPIEGPLRLLALECLVQGGLKEKDYAFFKRLILNSYGYEHILTFHALAKLDLIYQRGKASVAASQFQFSNLRRSFKLIVDDVNEQDPDDIAYVYSGYAPLSVRLVQCIIQRRALGSRIAGSGTSGWRGVEDILRNISGDSFEETQKGDERSAKAKTMLASSYTRREKKTTAVFFLGGITFTEVAALRYIAQQEAERRRILILTTGIIDGKQIIRTAIDEIPSMIQTPIMTGITQQ